MCAEVSASSPSAAVEPSAAVVVIAVTAAKGAADGGNTAVAVAVVGDVASEALSAMARARASSSGSV